MSYSRPGFSTVKPVLLAVVSALLFTACQSGPSGTSTTFRPDEAIKPYSENNWYWQYEGEPVLLASGSKDDNLYQIPTLKGHLDTMATVGGNYVRNVMSHRRPTGYETVAFERVAEKRYDLEQWNPEYWNRLERMLELTHERGIIVQLTLWEQHDMQEDEWNGNPWNPRHNVNYDSTEVHLKTGMQYENVQHHNEVQHDFFLTVPALNNDQTVLKYQKQFVDKVLSHTLQYDHVIYNITNELFNQHPADWSVFWANYIREQARQEGKRVYVTEMFQLRNMRAQQHRASFDHPETFDYVDISQNSRQQDQEHWDQLQWVRNYLADHPRPINHVKIYGGEVDWTHGSDHSIDCFWRNIIGGAASMRLHRPPYGIGLQERARRHIESAHMLTDAFNIFAAQPDSTSALLTERDPNEAYLSYREGRAYAVYFPNGGEIELDLTGIDGSFKLRWLNAEKSAWGPQSTVEGGGSIALETPAEGDWIALLKTQ